MDARAADALAVAVGHSLPGGLVEAMREVEELRARVADLEKGKGDVQTVCLVHTSPDPRH